MGSSLRKGIVLAVLAVTAVFAASSGAAPRTSGTVSRTAAKITSVTFSGTPAAPIVTIKGRGLLVPPANPPYSPSNQALCPPKIRGAAGRDYGVGFYVLAYDATTHKLKFAGGRYRPALRELDCIGLIVLSHSSRQLRLRFGAAYTELGYPHVVSGDTVVVVDNGASFRSVVRYR